MAKAWLECPAANKIILYDENANAIAPAAASHGLSFNTMNKKYAPNNNINMLYQWIWKYIL